MTAEQRLDRLERIAELFIRAGLHAQRNLREMDAKIKILVDAQIRNEERFAKFDERCKKYDALFAMYDERFAKSDERFKKAEAETDRILENLMEILRELRN
jgi:hypothetical protein